MAQLRKWMILDEVLNVKNTSFGSLANLVNREKYQTLARIGSFCLRMFLSCSSVSPRPQASAGPSESGLCLPTSSTWPGLDHPLCQNWRRLLVSCVKSPELLWNTIILIYEADSFTQLWYTSLDYYHNYWAHVKSTGINDHKSTG